jgi:hypothetical protein
MPKDERVVPTGREVRRRRPAMPTDERILALGGSFDAVGRHEGSHSMALARRPGSRPTTSGASSLAGEIRP